MTNSTSIECAHILENGQVDFIITNYPNSGLLNTHSVRAIREFRDVFVASAEHFPLQDKTFTLAELLDYPIMMLDRKSTTSEFLHSMFQKSHLDLVPEIELSSNDLLIDLAIGPDRLRPGFLWSRVTKTALYPGKFSRLSWSASSSLSTTRTSGSQAAKQFCGYAVGLN